jgi:hypothetical protein
VTDADLAYQQLRRAHLANLDHQTEAAQAALDLAAAYLKRAGRGAR